jgi:hypothetical protein
MATETQSEIVIDLNEEISPEHSVLSGDEWGEEVREQIELDRLDGEEGLHVVIRFPEWTAMVTTAFIRGLIRGSVLKLTDKGFWSKYSFTGPDFHDVIAEEVTNSERIRSGEIA